MSTASSTDPALQDSLQESRRELWSIQGGMRVCSRALGKPLKLFWGMLFMQSFLGAILILGWTNQLIRRCTLKNWWKRRPVQREDESFEEFIREHADLRIPRGWPNWFLTEDSPESPRRGPISRVGSLKTNFRSGFRTALNTWVVTAAPCALWMFAWYFGWNNSFHKGYELSGIGPLTGLAGVFLFIAVMFYLPLAQVRQAVTGEWRSFYELGFMRKLMRESWLACLCLALLYALLFLPVTVLKTLPGFFSRMNPALLEATPLEVTSILNRYFFWSALLVFPVFVVLRLAAARIYAFSLFRAVRRGTIPEASLGSVERTVLKELDLPQIEARIPSTMTSRLLGGAGKVVVRTLVTVLTGAVWFSFFGLVFIGQFFTYQGSIGWLNQPLVQLPWFRYLPFTVRNVWGEVLISLLLVAALTLVARAWRRVRRAVGEKTPEVAA